MTYAPPGTGLGGAREKKIEASQRLKQPLNRPADLTPAVKEALEKQRQTQLLRAEHRATQARLKAEYEAAHPKPGPRHG